MMVLMLTLPFVRVVIRCDYINIGLTNSVCVDIVVDIGMWVDVDVCIYSYADGDGCVADGVYVDVACVVTVDGGDVVDRC